MSEQIPDIMSGGSAASGNDQIQRLVTEAAVQLAAQQTISRIMQKIDYLEQFIPDRAPSYGFSGADGGGGGGGGGGGAGMGNFAYDEETHKIAGGAYCIHRQHYYVNGVTVTQAGPYRLRVGMRRVQGGTVGTPVIQPGSGFETPTEDYAYIPLYEFKSDLTIDKDYRGAPCVQSWE